MEPLGATASILTVLGGAGKTCKFLYDVFHDLADAPHDIRSQSEKLERLDWTIHHLVQAYTKLPQDFQLDPHLQRGILEFTDDIALIRAKVERKVASLKRGRGHVAHESCKWLLFDWQMRRFFGSMDHWDKILTRTTLAAQM